MEWMKATANRLYALFVVGSKGMFRPLCRQQGENYCTGTLTRVL